MPTYGRMPPELRDRYEREHDLLQGGDNFKADIFQLGYIIWLLAEQKAIPSSSYLCASSGCTTVPLFKCDAEHANPVQLPTCSGDVPSYFNRIIEACRSSNPIERKAAGELAEMFSDAVGVTSIPAGLPELIGACPSDEYDSLIYCNNCAGIADDHHYHCYTCLKGDFDLCPRCFEELEGNRCFDGTHRLIRRKLKNGLIFDGS